MRLSAAVLVLVLAACTSPAPDGIVRPFESEASYRAQREGALAALATAIGRPAANDVAACRAVPVGDQACGGPTGFAVYSLATADPSRVEAAASRVTALDRRANAQFEFVSTCELRLPPPLALRDGVCVAER